MTTMVGFSIAGSCITRAAKQVMVMLLPLPCVCHHAAFATLVGCKPLARRSHHMLDGGAHRVELVVTGNLLDERAVVLKQHKKRR